MTFALIKELLTGTLRRVVIVPTERNPLPFFGMRAAQSLKVRLCKSGALAVPRAAA